jgi:choline dehydrogenase
LANRLSEDLAIRVILIEAGWRDWHPLIHLPVGYMKLLDHEHLTWDFKAEADPGSNGRTIAYPRPLLGGSSSINGLIYIRSQPEDYDYWAQLWTMSCRSSSAPRGRQAKRPRFTAWREAHHLADDRAAGGRPGDHPGGAGARPRIPPRRQRSAAWRQRLDRLAPTDLGRAPACQRRRYVFPPAKKRPNLQIITNALVHRVVFDGKRAVGSSSHASPTSRASTRLAR